MTGAHPNRAADETEPEAWIRGGEFAAGSEEFYHDEDPTRHVAVGDFWMDRHQVTNAEFAAFVDETGYVAGAEQTPDPSMYPGAPIENLVPGVLGVRHAPLSGASQ